MNILIVDDNPENLWVLRALLETEAHAVLEAADGIEALAILEAQPVDVVISDILMPRMDGYRLCSAIRKNERWRTLPFIVYTATYISPKDEQTALDLGAHKFLRKPVSSAEIIAALSEVTRRGPETHLAPKLTIPETESLSQYSKRLVARLEEQHFELGCQEKELRLAHEKLRNLLAASPVVIYSLRVESQGLVPASVSDNLERMLGFTGSEALAPKWWEKHLHPDDRERMLSLLSVMTSEDQGTDEYRLQRKGGGHIWVRDDRRLVRDAQGRPVEIIGSWADITSRKRAELRTEVQHAVTAALAEAAPFPETTKKFLEIICRRLEWDVGGFWILDRAAKALRCVEIWHPPSTEFLEFADATQNLVCLREEELPGLAWASGEPEWIPDVMYATGFNRRTAAAKLGLHGALVLPVKLQTEVFGVLEFFSRRVLQPDAEMLALFAGLATQVGQFLERKRLEEQFRQSQKMEAIGQLAGGVAHDFNNLLTVIQGHTQLLLSAENLNPVMAGELQQVVLASERAARLTSQLLAFSRKQVMQSVPVDLNEIVASVSKMLQRIIGEDVALRLEPGRGVSAVQGDPGMVEQVLTNLVVNARDAMRNGGTLTLATSRVDLGEADARLHPNGRPGEFTCLRVKDTGCGMPPETMVRIFEPFFTTKALGKGTGLGLATVHSIVQQHKGWVEVESQPGKGTTFNLYFPAAGQIAQPGTPEPASSEVSGGSETILLVEDEPAIRELARIILERQGYRILEAGSGIAALAVWEKHADRINLIITDMVMPDGMTGRELAERLRTRRPTLKVIYSTGYSPEALDQDLNLEVGLNYLPKPYDPQRLARIVRKRLDT